MQLKINQQAPDFTTTDVFGEIIQLKKLKDHKVYLVFQRNAGCPVCNLHVHELIRHADYFATHNIKVILVYESTKDKMLEYLADRKYPFYFVADTDNRLYSLYSVERSMTKVMRSLFNGLIGKAMAGKKMFKKPIKQDGHSDTIPAEFLIDGYGNLSNVHYGRFIGDHLAMRDIK